MKKVITEKIRENLREDKIQEALEELLLLLKENRDKTGLEAFDNYYREAIILNSRLRRLERESLIGIIDNNFITLQQNKIIGSILDLTNVIEHESKFLITEQKQEKDLNNKIEITIDGNFEDFDEEKKEDLLKKLQEIMGLGISEITIKNVRRG